MTSRISLIKLIKEELRHHIVSIFAVVLAFLAEILFFYFEILRVLQPEYITQYAREVVAAAGEPSFPTMISVIILAVFMAVEYFGYLHSQKKTDFYMSLPLRRKDKFNLGMIVCLFIFSVPCSFAIVCESMVGYASGYGSVLFLQNMMWSFICKILTFLVCFLTMTLSMIMTGSRMIAVMGFGAFSLYVPIFLKWLIPAFEQLFFDTYTGMNNFSESWDFFSPVSLVYGLVMDYENWTIDRHFSYFIVILIFIVIIGFLTKVLYVRRPAEAAGRAMAFPKANSTIRFMLVIPLALYCGYFLQQTAPDGANVWLFAGMIIGAVLLHGIIESIFRFDLRGMLVKKKQLGVSILICFAFILVFQIDLLKYDEYVPKKDEVESVVILPDADGVYFYYDIDVSENDGIYGEGIQDTIELAEILVEQNDILKESMQDEYDEYDSVGWITIEYQMKNGGTKAREYYMDLENKEVKMLLDKICATEEFKNDFHALYNIKYEDIMKITLDDIITVENLMLSEEEQKEFLEVYLQELTELSLTEMEEKNKIARFRVNYNNSVEIGYLTGETYDIYEHFDRTIKVLEDCGVVLNAPLADCEVLSIEVEEEYSGEAVEKPTFIVEDTTMLEEVKDEIILMDLYDNGYVTSVKDYRYGTVKVLINGRTNYYDIYVRPDTVKKLESAAIYSIEE